MSKDSSITEIGVDLNSFFKIWLEFTRPIHKLNSNEIRVLSLFLCKRYELSKVISDDTLLDKTLFSHDIKYAIMNDVDLNRNQFNVILTNMRKKGVLSIDNKISKRIIPDLSNDIKKFNFVVIFNFSDDN